MSEVKEMRKENLGEEGRKGKGKGENTEKWRTGNRGREKGERLREQNKRREKSNGKGNGDEKTGIGNKEAGKIYDKRGDIVG